MDDDQLFVQDVVNFIEDHPSRVWGGMSVAFQDDGRDAVVSLFLSAGDKYRITIEEVHE